MSDKFRGDNACLQQQAQRACCPLHRIKGHTHQLPVRRNIRDFPAVPAPHWLRTGTTRYLNFVLRARGTVGRQFRQNPYRRSIGPRPYPVPGRRANEVGSTQSFRSCSTCHPGELCTAQYFQRAIIGVEYSQLPGSKDPMRRLSGDQKGYIAPSVAEKSCALAKESERNQGVLLPS